MNNYRGLIFLSIFLGSCFFWRLLVFWAVCGFCDCISRFSWSCSQDTRVHFTISAHKCAFVPTSLHFTIFLIVLTSMHFTIWSIVLSSVHFTIPACSCMFLHNFACSRFGPISFQLLSTSIYLPTIFLIVLTSSNSLPRSLFFLSVGVSSTILGKRVHASYGNSILVRDTPFQYLYDILLF